MWPAVHQLDGYVCVGGCGCAQAVTSSVAKTGRLLVSHEAPLSSGFGAELVAEVSSRCFLSLEAPPARVSTAFVTSVTYVTF
jgi:pyruvate/2-oxoglutarate/acetoin dehydrogenase E1 component